MDENKNLKDENLEEAAGGRYLALKEELRAALPLDVKDQLSKAVSDVQVCKILADNNIDLSKIEEKIENAGFNMKRIGLQLADDNLAGIVGGFEDSDYGNIKCRCGNEDRNEFSRQFWASLLTNGTFYRCKKCNKYLVALGRGNFDFIDEIEYV